MVDRRHCGILSGDGVDECRVPAPLGPDINARDIDGLIGYRDPSIELQSAFAAVGGAVYHGHAPDGDPETE